jgi:hypothetical protein
MLEFLTVKNKIKVRKVEFTRIIVLLVNLLKYKITKLNNNAPTKK